MGVDSAAPSNSKKRLRFKRAKNPRLVHNRSMNFTKNIGMLLLAIYLILVGIASLTAIVIPAVLMGILALLAGIFILIGR